MRTSSFTVWVILQKNLRENAFSINQFYHVSNKCYIQIPGQGKWWKLRMLHGPEIPRVHSTDLAISRRNSILYMTGHNTHDLFSINLEEVREDETLGAASHVRSKFFAILRKCICLPYLRENKYTKLQIVKSEHSCICIITDARYNRLFRNIKITQQMLQTCHFTHVFRRTAIFPCCFT